MEWLRENPQDIWEDLRSTSRSMLSQGEAIHRELAQGRRRPVLGRELDCE